jgi:hypothetical protein
MLKMCNKQTRGPKKIGYLGVGGGVAGGYDAGSSAVR